MKKALLLLLAVAMSFPANRVLGQSGPDRASSHRKVAITIDDLPVTSAPNLEARKQITSGLLETITRFEAPAIGFVNERKLGVPQPDPEEVALLQQWIDAGLELGNHTYSHPSLFSTPLEDFKNDVLRGEEVTRRLMSQKGTRLRYFRHPFLNTGPSLAVKRGFEEFLEENDYKVAPVTIDNSEWIYAAAYSRVHASQDSGLLARIGSDYVRYMAEVFDFNEQLSQELLGRELSQTLLIHANRLNSDYLDELLTMLVDRGYQLVSLEEALRDPAYQSPDDYVGRAGISWLQRWAVTRGDEYRPETAIPDWVEEIAFPNGR